MPNQLSEQAAAEVKRLAEKAVPHRIEITENLGKQMRFLRQSFVLHFVKDIDKKKDKEEYIDTKIKQERIFRKIKDYMHYEGQGSDNPRYDGLDKVDDLIEEVSTVIQYLRYIGHTQNLDHVLAKYGVTITTRSLESVYPQLAEEEVKDNITKVFNAANTTQSSICKEANEIKIHIYGELEEGIKYDAKYNKSGIKANEFDKLTTLEAAKQKSEELAEKKLETLKDSIGATIDSKLNVQTVAQTIVQQ